MRSGKRGRVVVVAALWTTGTSTTLAQPDEHALEERQEEELAPPVPDIPWIAWDAPPECSRRELEEQIQRALGRPIDAGSEISVAIRIETAEDEVLAHVSISEEGETNERTVSLPTCEEATRFAALAIALALGPSDPSRPSEELPGETPASNDRTPILTPEEPTPLDRPERRDFARDGWFLGALATGTTALLPKGSVGLTVVAGRAFGDAVFDLRLTYMPGETYQLAAAQNPVRMMWLGGALGGCYFFRTGLFRGGPCARAQVGGVNAEERPANDEPPRGGTGLYVGLLGGLEAHFEVAPRVHLLAAVSAALPLHADPFVLTDGSVVHRTPFGIDGSLGLVYFF